MNTKYDPTTDPRGFAIWAHGPQQYGPGVPYVRHLDHVVDLIRRFAPEYPAVITEAGGIAVMETAGYLHDVVEDTMVSVELVETLFGTRVSNLVWSVTNEPGANRRERHAKTHPKTRRLAGAVFLKLCDRIANITTCVETHDTRISMYLREMPAFQSALCRPGEFDMLWAALDSAFGDVGLPGTVLP